MTEVIHCIVTQMQRNTGATLFACHGFNLKLARAGAHPTHALVFGCASSARLNCNGVGHNIARVKAHPKLPNQLRVFLLVARQFADKVARAALGNGAQVVDGFLLGQANAVVGNGDCLGFFVKANAYV